MEINNHTLAMVLGRRLAQKGLVSDRWGDYDPPTLNERVAKARAAYCATVAPSLMDFDD
jgi:hypothetical protein